jgi:delta 1-pyrroline-5-carboxylate dehydrogenase
MERAITPFNFPHQINLAKAGSAFAAADTVVLKPARRPMVRNGIRRICRSGGDKQSGTGRGPTLAGSGEYLDRKAIAEPVRPVSSR